MNYKENIRKNSSSRRKLKPTGWKRTHDLTPESLGVTKIMFEWTHIKTGTKVLITRYNTRLCGFGRYGYNLLTLTKNSKEHWGDEVYSLFTAVSLAYQVYMKEEAQ